MGSLYCPNCSKAISELANISACPNCYHPFNAKVWLETYERKQKKIETDRAQSKAWKENGLCEYCGGKLFVSEWEKGYDWGGSYKYERYACENCHKKAYDCALKSTKIYL